MLGSSSSPSPSTCTSPSCSQTDAITSAQHIESFEEEYLSVTDEDDQHGTLSFSKHYFCRSSASTEALSKENSNVPVAIPSEQDSSSVYSKAMLSPFAKSQEDLNTTALTVLNTVENNFIASLFEQENVYKENANTEEPDLKLYRQGTLRFSRILTKTRTQSGSIISGLVDAVLKLKSTVSIPRAIPSVPLLPDLDPCDASKKCLILDLDETLVHSMMTVLIHNTILYPF